jgi:pimeloyl-ACP methyl ester carboxylesterase
MITPAHGRAYAGAIAGARYHLIAEAGHLPQLETPDELLKVITDFAGGTAAS